MTIDHFADFVARLEVAGCDPEEGPGGQWGALCPVPSHGGDGDGRASLSFARGDTQPVVVTCHAGCSFADVSRALRVGQPEMPRRVHRATGTKRGAGVRGTFVCSYSYVDQHGEELFQIVRFEKPKEFRARRWVNHRWQWSLEDTVYRPLYNLPALLAADLDTTVWLVEGEKDADRLASLGLVATTNAFGAEHWDVHKYPDYLQTLAGRPVVVVPDNDKAGRQGARKRAESLAKAAESVRIVEPPGLGPHGDISDWLDAGHTVDDLLALLDETPEGTTTTGVTPALDELARWEPSDGIRWALGDPEVLDELSEASEADLALALLDLRARGARQREVDMLSKAVRAHRREREASTPPPTEETPTTEDILREVASIVDAEDARIDDLAGLLDELVAFFGGWVWYPTWPEQPWTVALWNVHTFCLDSFDYSPRLVVRAPTRRCGKSTVLKLLRRASFNNPGIEALATAATVFRGLAEERQTLLIDEVDALFDHRGGGNEELRAIINHGFEAEGIVRRQVPDQKKGYRTEKFPAFCAMALTGIGRMPETIEDRSIVIRLERKLGAEVPRFNTRRVKKVGQELASRAAAWALRHGEELRAVDPAFPTGLDDRAEDCWEPLLRLAEVAGGEWPERARRAALVLSAGRDDTYHDADNLRLLEDLYVLFEARGWPKGMWILDIVSDLRDLEESPWSALRNGEGPTRHHVTRAMDSFGVKSVQIRFGGRNRRGYRRDDLAALWTRYLGREVPTAESDQEGAQNGSGDSTQRGVAVKPASQTLHRYTAGQGPNSSGSGESSNGSKSASDQECSDVAVETEELLLPPVVCPPHGGEPDEPATEGEPPSGSGMVL